MSWVTLTIDDLAALFDEGEASLVAADDSVLADCLADAVARAREAAAANANNLIGDDVSSVPRALRQQVLAIARRDLLLRYALPITQERQAAATAAETEIETARYKKRSYLSPDGQRVQQPAARPYVIPETIQSTNTTLL